jgi:hypothetical protein
MALNSTAITPTTQRCQGVLVVTGFDYFAVEEPVNASMYSAGILARRRRGQTF